MSLTTYRNKRNFSKTSEPKGAAGKSGGDLFVVQKHAARRLHYDLRLELGGVLLSWAVTRGPSLVPGEKRLAVHVEDHPVDYGSFEGTIPKGEYGAGSVLLWDRGRWSPDGDPKKGLKKGHLEFTLEGEKLKGRWHLVRMARRRGEKRDNWLLIKGDDGEARGEDDPDILEERPESVKTGRDIAEIGDARAALAPAGAGGGGKRRGGSKEPPRVSGSKTAPMPSFIEPQLATLKPEAPRGDKWLHEIKFDGYRLQLRLENGRVKLLTRSGLDWTKRFGKAVPEAAKALPAKSAILDGELVVERENGSSDFSALQADLSEERTDRFVFYAFDLLYLEGKDLREVPLEARKEALRALLDGAAPALRYSEHFDEEGALILKHACRLSLEGVISKVRDGKYVSGRGRSWIKSKCAERQEFVICGYVPSSTSDKLVGSLVLGHYEKGKLVHDGRVGTGFSREVAQNLMKALRKLETEDSPFSGKLGAAARRGVHFVRPEMVAEVEFRAWTADGLVRHASFRGLREDKPAAEIGREDGAAIREGKLPRGTVKLSHPDRIYWPEAGVTKQGLADYYAQVWNHMAPFVTGRPLALLRCPTGITGHCFFQKHAWKGLNRNIQTFDDPQDKSDEPLLAIRDFDGLIGLIQGGALEIHSWQSRVDALETPDQIVMDLDPGEGTEWSAVIEAAREVKHRLEHAGLTAFLKTSGGKGLHVVSPLKPDAGWDAVKGFAKSIADDMAGEMPNRYVATVSKAKRRGRILIDYLRNGRGATAVVPYCTRARPGAAVSMPLAWDELTENIGPAYFTVENAPARLANMKDDPWASFHRKAAALPKLTVKR
ncbi:MAG: DNA ligase D [Flavobacteriaceae bacterium]